MVFFVNINYVHIGATKLFIIRHYKKRIICLEIWIQVFHNNNYSLII